MAVAKRKKGWDYTGQPKWYRSRDYVSRLIDEARMELSYMPCDEISHGYKAAVIATLAVMRDLVLDHLYPEKTRKPDSPASK